MPLPQILLLMTNLRVDEKSKKKKKGLPSLGAVPDLLLDEGQIGCVHKFNGYPATFRDISVKCFVSTYPAIHLEIPSIIRLKRHVNEYAVDVTQLSEALRTAITQGRRFVKCVLNAVLYSGKNESCRV